MWVAWPLGNPLEHQHQNQMYVESIKAKRHNITKDVINSRKIRLLSSLLEMSCGEADGKTEPKFIYIVVQSISSSNIASASLVKRHPKHYTEKWKRHSMEEEKKEST
jgi:hypothetical protein